ncbi:hypothetical protein H8A99_03765 [Bradyrhizobium sp. Arg68]|nr:hypothetical protein [Bradyrhizobium ivorense]MCC8935634.1 hypothetical protein [Bradyrhizobium ivorense]
MKNQEHGPPFGEEAYFVASLRCIILALTVHFSTWLVTIAINGGLGDA